MIHGESIYSSRFSTWYLWKLVGVFKEMRKKRKKALNVRFIYSALIGVMYSNERTLLAKMFASPQVIKFTGRMSTEMVRNSGRAESPWRIHPLFVRLDSLHCVLLELKERDRLYINNIEWTVLLLPYCLRIFPWLGKGEGKDIHHYNVLVGHSEI